MEGYLNQMSRILKRPMFRRGGSSNEGIMTGLVDRTKHADQPFVGLSSPFNEERTAADVEAITGAMDKYAALPKTTVPLGQVGLNLISGRYAGDGLLKNIAGSAQDPYAAFVKADDVRNMALAKRKAAAVSTSLGQQIAERNKLKSDLASNLKDMKKFKTDQENKLFSSYSGNKVVQSFNKSTTQVKKLLTSLETDSGPGDIAAIFAFMKTLDPESVVRESEFATAANSSGLFRKLWNTYNKMLTGEALPEEVRSEFKTAGLRLYQQNQSALDNIRADYEKIAKNQGLDVTNIFADADIRPLKIETSVTIKDGPPGAVTVPQKFKVPPGTKLVDYMDGWYYFELPDGRRFRTKGLK